MKRKIELLAPAKNLECGIEAINHGADAVYIGAPQFSARAAAGNTLEDIKALTSYAHTFNVKIYVALNTILNDEELQEAEKLIWRLWKEAHIDALIIQDMGITMLNLPPIPLHASTQMDNRTPEKVKFMQEAGFRQIVLARELTVDEIRAASKDITVPIEVFVHGALCVCYSGQCYLSEALSKRSANKGACAQYCRLPYEMEDAEGENIISKKHLLSMKDLNLSNNLEELIDAGASSLKIEGRLKDVTYVKNTVAYYRKKIDEILARRPEYIRASYGESKITFEPNVEKSFNRGFTEYFFHGRSQERIWSVDSPKSQGEYIGTVTEVTKKYIKLDTQKQLNNGDGLCFFHNEELQGIQVNRAEKNLVYTFEPLNINKGVKVYRNYDHEFEKQLERNNTAKRQLPISFNITDSQNGFTLSATELSRNLVVSITFDADKEPAKKDPTQNIVNTLSKTGDTIFMVKDVEVSLTSPYFIPASVLSDWRRSVLEKLEQDVTSYAEEHEREKATFAPTFHSFPVGNITYLGNVMNAKSESFYTQHQSKVLQPAFEKEVQTDVPLMFTRHCVKQSLGWCPKETKDKLPYKEPFFLKYKNTKLRLSFDCKNCEMKVFKA